MKRRVISVTLVLMMCFFLCGGALAQSSDDAVPQPRGAITLYAGLDNLGGGSYRPRATIETGSSESLSVSFTLYKVVGGSEQYITSGSNSGTGRKVTASKTVSLSSGTYRIYYSGSGNTVSDSDNRLFYI